MGAADHVVVAGVVVDAARAEAAWFAADELARVVEGAPVGRLELESHEAEPKLGAVGARHAGPTAELLLPEDGARRRPPSLRAAAAS